MYRIHNRRAIINRKALIAELDEQVRSWGSVSARARANVLQIFKAALYRGVGEIRGRFEADHIKGAEVVQANAFLVDQLVRCIYDFAGTSVYPPGPGDAADTMTITATGGYGRGELAPFSDIDVMFLLSAPTSRLERIVEYVLYILWDSGLQVGHATRTIDECVRLSKDDLTIRTSLLETRWLWGSKPLFHHFEQRFRSDVVAGTSVAFVEQKLAERDSRHERMGDSRYVLEPHNKEGKGGLRDLQTLFWIVKYLYHVKNVGGLVELGVFTEADARQFRRAENFLWTVRCCLHYVAGRPEERLTFNVQELIANRLGYHDRPTGRGVERFMKHYFRVTKTVGDLTRILCAVLEDEHKKPRRRFRLPSLSRALFRRLPPGLIIDGGRLALDGAEALERDPVLFLRLFYEAQRQGLDIHPQALRLVHQNLRMVDAKLRASPEANRLFVSMLTHESGAELALKRLGEAGVFGRFIPDFGRVVSQMQYDMYHVYTVDEHTIRAIGILNRIERGELREQHPAATAALGEIRSRRALYLAVLLHDIAKGRGGEHCELGADIAFQLAPRLGLDDWESETVAWLVRRHLLMSRTAFKRDIDDWKTVVDFTANVQSPERLRMLLILTNVDIRAVGPNIWNAWKCGLLDELYYRALEELEMAAGQPAVRRTQRVERAKGRLRDVLVDWDDETRETYISRGYSDYWLGFRVDEHARHFELMRRADRAGTALCVQARPHPSRDVTEITIYAPDHAGLFAQIAGAISLSSASIVGAKVVTLANSMALDVFLIQDLSGRPFDSDDRLQRLSMRIEAAVVGNMQPAQELRDMRERALPSRTGVFKVAPRVIFDNKASATHTVIEVNGRDRPGFLHDVTSTLTALGLQIVSAHISTYGERVVDVFYVKDVFGLKIEHGQKLRRLEHRLLEAIVPAEERDGMAEEAQTESVAAE
ncbi:MAG: [protein-PII] uridylyltransferase [Rhodospirillales bacterium]|nr:[protein-PII] uridylyltransferase [Rhodospirillales bacterium]